MTLLSIGDFHFKGTREHYQNGEYLVTLDGWTDGVPMRRDSRPLPQNHGDFDVPGFLEARTVDFTASAYADSRMQLAHRGRGFTALLAQGNSRRVTVELEGQTLWGMARAGDAAAKWRLDSGGVASARASMELLFANPRLFGESHTFAGTSPVAYHYGNFPATPVLTVTGSMSGYTIAGPTGNFTVTAAVVAGSPHVIDMSTGALTVAGVRVFGAVSSAALWTIPGGAQVTHTLTPTSGTGSLSVAVLDTFI